MRSTVKFGNYGLAENSKDILLLLIFGIIVFGLYYYSNFDGITAPDAMKYGTVARNIIDGKGMTTNSISMYRIKTVEKTGFAFIEAPPLHPIVLSAFIYILGAKDYTLALNSGFFYLLIIPILYLFTRELFNRKIAIISTSIYIISGTMLYLGISGLTEPLYIFLLLVTFYALYKSKTTGHLFLVGVLFGISRLTRDNSLFFLIPFTLYIFSIHNEKRLFNCFIFLLGFILATLPLYIRYYVLTGNPFFTIHTFSAGVDTPIYPEYSLHRSLVQISSLQFIMSYPLLFFKKYVSNLLYYKHFFTGLTEPLIMSFFIVSLFRWQEDKKKKGAIKLLFLGMIVLQVLIVSIGVVRIRYFYIFIPFIIIFAVDYFFMIFDTFLNEKKIFKMFICFVLLAILILPTAYTIGKALNDGKQNEYHWLKDFLDKNTKRSDVIVSDISYAIGWYGNRRAIWLPISLDVVEQIDKEHIKVDAILLTNKDFDNPYINISQEWRDLLEGTPEKYNDFELVNKFDDGKIVAVLYMKCQGAPKNGHLGAVKNRPFPGREVDN